MEWNHSSLVHHLLRKDYCCTITIYRATKVTLDLTDVESLISKLLYVDPYLTLQILNVLGVTLDDHLYRFAIEQDYSSIGLISNPAKDLCELAINISGNAIRYIHNQTEELQLMAIKRNPFSIGYLKNPSLSIKLEAVKRQGITLEYIKKPTPEIELEAVKQDWRSLEYVKEENQSNEICLLALEQSEFAKVYIKNKNNKNLS